MATKIVKTLKFPNSSDEYQINAVKLGGKTASEIVEESSLITVADIDAICGTTIIDATNNSEVTF